MSVRDPWQVQYTQSQHRIPLPDRGGKLAKSFVKILDEEKNVKKRWGTTTVFTKFLLIFCATTRNRGERPRRQRWRRQKNWVGIW